MSGDPYVRNGYDFTPRDARTGHASGCDCDRCSLFRDGGASPSGSFAGGEGALTVVGASSSALDPDVELLKKACWDLLTKIELLERGAR